MRDAVAIVLGAGGGERLGADVPKAFVQLGGSTPLLGLAASAAAECPDVATLVLVVPAGWEEEAQALAPSGLPCVVVTGGPTRQDSVRLALRAVGARCQAVLCHDAARPFARPELF